jgi:hypothetical protein
LSVLWVGWPPTAENVTYKCNVRQIYEKQQLVQVNQSAQCQFLSAWWWAVCRSKHVEQLIKHWNNKF